jgi:hypothetical protein
MDIPSSDRSTSSKSFSGKKQHNKITSELSEKSIAKRDSYANYLTESMLSTDENKQKKCIFTHTLYSSITNIVDHFISLYGRNYKDYRKKKRKDIVNNLNNIVNFFHIICSSGLLEISKSQINIISEYANKKNIDDKLKICVAYLCPNDDTSHNISNIEKKVHAIIDSDNFMIISPENMALQITFTMGKYFMTMRASDFLNSKDSSNMHNIANYFDRLAYLVTTEILRVYGTKKKCECIKYFIDVAKELKKLNNFHGLMAVILGLNNKALSRLHDLWYKIKEHKNVLDELTNFMSAIGNYRIYRKHIHDSKKLFNVIPFLVIEVTDILHICELPIFDQEDDINMLLIDTLYKNLFIINEYQSKLFIPENYDDEHISKYINECVVFDEETLWKLSNLLLCESKNDIKTPRNMMPKTKKRRSFLTFSLKRSDDDSNERSSSNERKSSNERRSSISNSNNGSSSANNLLCSHNKMTLMQINYCSHADESSNNVQQGIPKLNLRACVANDNTSEKDSGSGRNLKFSYREWSTDDVSIWLKSIDLKHMITLFKKENITGKTLTSLTRCDMKVELNMVLGDIYTLLNEIEILKNKQ